jgi:hypothetical protein
MAEQVLALTRGNTMPTLLQLTSCGVGRCISLCLVLCKQHAWLQGWQLRTVYLTSLLTQRKSTRM